MIPAPALSSLSGPVSVRCRSAAHHTTQGRRRWACGVIGWERWNGACNGIERTGRECTEGLLFDADVMVRWWVVRRWLEGLSVRGVLGGVLGVTLSHTLSLTCVLNCGSDMFWSLFSLFWGGPWVAEVAAGWPWVVVGGRGVKCIQVNKVRLQGR